MKTNIINLAVKDAINAATPYTKIDSQVLIELRKIYSDYYSEGDDDLDYFND